MKNLPKFLIILLVVFLIVDAILLGIYLSKSKTFKLTLPSLFKKEVVQESSSSSPPEIILALPVKNEYLATTPDYAQDSDHLVFFLPGEELVYAVFGGEVSRVVQNTTIPGSDIPFDNIILEKKDENLTMSYLVFGKALVKEGDLVSQGEVIAKAKAGTGPGCLGGANLGLYLFEDGQPARLTKEMISAAKKS